MTRAVYEQLQETLFELKRVEERKNKYRGENSAILSSISAMTEASNKTEVFNILLKVIRRYVSFDNALVLTRNIHHYEYTCLVSTSSILKSVHWRDGNVFKRCVNGQTVVLYAPDQVNEFLDFNSHDFDLCRSALISGMTVNGNEALLILFGNQKGNFDTKGKQVIERFSPLIERTILDIDYRERLQSMVELKTQELNSSRQRFRDFAKTASDWFWEVNEKYQFSYLSSPANEYIGANPEEIRTHLDKQPEVKQKLLEMMGHQLPFSEVELKVNRLGQEQWISLSGRPFYDKRGNSLGYRGTAKDITRRKRRLHELQLARQQAESANAAKSQFLAMMSHEIRTPLNAVMGLLDVMSDSDLKPEQEIWVNQMDKSAQLLLTIISDVLDLSKIESDRFSMHPEKMNPRDSVALVFNQLKEISYKKNIELREIIDTSVPDAIFLDENRFAQILLNLVGNAVKFTEKGSVTITMKKQENQLHIDVIDTGIGIDVEKTSDIFEPFTQADGSITRKYGGTGLGLSICKKLVGLMSGTINFTSRVGEGTRFMVKIPLLPMSNLLTLEQDKKEMQPIKPLSILVAEDSKANQMVIKVILEKVGHKVALASNGQEAVDMIDFTPDQFDLVLMDMSMPVLCGIEATRQLRRKNHTLPIFAITANAMNEDREKCLAAGMNDFLTKPIRAAVLNDLLTKHLL